MISSFFYSTAPVGITYCTQRHVYNQRSFYTFAPSYRKQSKTICFCCRRIENTAKLVVFVAVALQAHQNYGFVAVAIETLQNLRCLTQLSYERSETGAVDVSPIETYKKRCFGMSPL